MSSSIPILEIWSEDPEVSALLALIKGLSHFGKKEQFTMRHFKVLAAVEICLKLAERPARMADIEVYTKLKQADFEQHVTDLVEARYLHAVIPTFGDLTPTYKLGTMGGTVIRTMFRHLLPLRKCANDG